MRAIKDKTKSEIEKLVIKKQEIKQKINKLKYELSQLDTELSKQAIYLINDDHTFLTKKIDLSGDTRAIIEQKPKDPSLKMMKELPETIVSLQPKDVPTFNLPNLELIATPEMKSNGHIKYGINPA